MKDNNSNSSGRQSLVRILGTLVALALLVYVLSQQGWPQIVAAFQLIAPWRLALAMFLMIISRFAVSGRWYMLLRSGGIKVTPWQGLRINFAGLFANNFMPTTVGGDVIRLAGALQLGFDGAISTASLVVDRLVGMAGMAMALPFGLPRILQVGALPGSSFLQPPGVLSGVSIPFLGKWGVQAWERGSKLLQKLLSALSIWLKQPRALILGLAFTWINMLCLFSVLALLFNGMQQPISFWLAGGLYSIVYFVTLIPFSVNGYGLQELSMTLIFSTFGGASVSAGITAALLFRTLMMLASLPGVLFIPGMLAEIRLRRPSAG